MEARDCTARDADEHDREKWQSFRVRISQPVGQFREFRMIDVEHCQNAYRHKQQSYRKEGIYLPDDFIYRQQRSQDIIKENNDYPELGVQDFWRETCQQSCRTSDEHHADQHHQHDRESTHELFEPIAQKAPDKLRQTLPLVAHRQCPG